MSKKVKRRDTRVLWACCEECGRPLERTPGGYLACSSGHGKLIADALEAVGEGSLFGAADSAKLDSES